MADLEQLLEVQRHDTAIDQLEHRRRTLPARADLARVEEEVAALEREIAAVQARHDEAAGQQSALETELATVENRIADLEKRMYASTGPARDLQAIAGEVDALKRRRSELEDEAIAAMEGLEPVAAELEGLKGRLVVLDGEAERLRIAIAEAEVEIDAEVKDERARRDAAAEGIAGPLLAGYERLRTKLGGVGAARLSGASCTGCHLTLPNVEVERIRKLPADELVHCDQCGRILVR